MLTINTVYIIILISTNNNKLWQRAYIRRNMFYEDSRM